MRHFRILAKPHTFDWTRVETSLRSESFYIADGAKFGLLCCLSGHLGGGLPSYASRRPRPRRAGASLQDFGTQLRGQVHLRSLTKPSGRTRRVLSRRRHAGQQAGPERQQWRGLVLRLQLLPQVLLQLFHQLGQKRHRRPAQAAWRSAYTTRQH